MKIVIERLWPKKKYVIGRLFINGQFICNTLEPPLSTEVLMKTTNSHKAIMPGTYFVKLQWSRRFKCVLPRLQNVPGRDAILIHAGNTEKDTGGCILPGYNNVVGRVNDSKKALDQIMERLQTAHDKNEPIVVTIR